jgi:hypothetical protein
MIKYGIQFPDGLTDATIELHCYRWGAGDSKQGFKPLPQTEKWEHLYRAITILWPEKMENGKKGYIVHDWTIPRIKAWCDIGCDGPWDIWWGPSSVGKTTDAAVIILAHWLSAPDKTTVHVVSTKMEALKLRIFGEIIRFHGLVPHLPGEVKASTPCIVLGDENSKNGIFGHAVWKGNVDQAMNNLIGVHNEFNALVIDEMQGSLPAAPAAADNLSSGREFKGLGMGNPQRRLDCMGKYSQPIKGWDSITDATKMWKTKYGTVHFWDGLDSPGIREPDRYFFLLNQKMIEDTARIHGRNSPAFWSQRRGFIPPEGLTPVIMSESFIVQHKMQAKAIWESGYQVCAGFDPAYSAKGDRAVMYPVRYGTMVGGLFGIEFQDAIPIELGSVGEKLMSDHITDQIMAATKGTGITPDRVGMDCTGVQGALADFIEKIWGRGLLRVQFGGKPSSRIIEDDGNGDTCDKRYKNRVTELWFAMRYFGERGHIRGLSDKSAEEFSTRELEDQFTPVKIEGKDLMKQRTGESPDESDAAVCALEWIISREGFLPGTMAMTPERVEEADQAYRNYDVDSESMVYLSSGL